MSRRPTDEDYSAFVHGAWPSLYRTAYLLLGDHGLAEDLTQTALVKTYTSWRNVRDLSAAQAYARTVLVNTATSWFRLRSWRNELPTETLPEATDSAAPGSTDPGDRSLVLAALRQLAPRQRAVVVLRYYEDLSVEETSRVLGCSVGTVKSQTHDALARLRSLLGDAVVPHPLESPR